VIVVETKWVVLAIMFVRMTIWATMCGWGCVLSLRHTLVSSVMLCSVADILLASTAGEQHVALVRTHQNAKRCLFNVFQSDYSSKYFQTNIPGSVCQGNF